MGMGGMGMMGMGGGRMKYDREVSQDSMSTKCEEARECVCLPLFPTLVLGRRVNFRKERSTGALC